MEAAPKNQSLLMFFRLESLGCGSEPFATEEVSDIDQEELAKEQESQEKEAAEQLLKDQAVAEKKLELRKEARQAELKAEIAPPVDACRWRRPSQASPGRSKDQYHPLMRHRPRSGQNVVLFYFRLGKVYVRGPASVGNVEPHAET